MKDVIVYVLAQKRGRDVIVRLAAETYGLSHEYVLMDEEKVEGNPYLIFRHLIREWIGPHLPTQPSCGSAGFSIVVLQPTSGDL